MQVILEVCDICGKKHGIMLKRDGVIFGDRSCFLDFCNSVWLRWEKEEFESRGVVSHARKESSHEKEELSYIERELIRDAKPGSPAFKGKVVKS